MPTSYEDIKARSAERNRIASRQGRDIGPLPKVVDPERKARCRESFRDFCETYLASDFNKAWCEDHLKVISGIERAVTAGDMQAIGMPRGSGKTTLCRAGVLWAILYGFHKFVMLIAATGEKAQEQLENIITELETNELLMEDFPEACLPIEQLDGIAARQNGQLLDGKRTRVHVAAGKGLLRLAIIPGKTCSGAVIKVVGITGAVRGAQWKDADTKKTLRPSLILIDDPQTRESAENPFQVAKRAKIIAADVLKMGGPGEAVSALMACTVIETNDLAEQALDRKQMPQWRGIKCQFVYQFPTNMKLWEQYGEILRDALRDADDDDPEAWRPATDFYIANREQMDEGCVVAWNERFIPQKGEISAIQHAMNVFLEDASVFYAEYQNDPKGAKGDDQGFITVQEIAAKVSALRPLIIPDAATELAVGIDVQRRLLFWQAIAFQADFTGDIVAYGTWPRQERSTFRASDAQQTLQQMYPNRGDAACIYQALQDCLAMLFETDWNRETTGAVPMRPTVGLVDAGWGEHTDTVFQAIRESRFSHAVIPSFGKGIGPSERRIHEVSGRQKPGEIRGDNWIVRVDRDRHSQRFIRFDANHWKTFVHRRFATQRADAGSLCLFEAPAHRHELFAQHQWGEYYKKTADEMERQVLVFKEYPDKRDQHWLDTNVLCHVGASFRGCALPENQVIVQRVVRRPEVTLSDLQRDRR